MNESNLHNYQRYTVDFILNHLASGCFLDMGCGKTVSTLTAINRLMYEDLEVSKVLVIAPKRVAEDTWTKEVEKWDHLKHLRVSKVLGTERQRKEALRKEADIYVINRENVCWLVAQYRGSLPFDMLVIDELSSFKNPKAQRFKALRLVRPQIDRVVGLTGTPAPNGLCDIWSQIYLLDQGERLEKTITRYREKYFRPGRSNGQVVFDYKILDGSEKAIYQKISDICVSMKAEDYLELPPRLDHTAEISLPDDIRARYEDFEKTEVLRLLDQDGESPISAVNAAALSSKLLQFSNGAIYDADRNVHEIHDYKLEALEEIVEAANGEPVLIFYSFRHDIGRIKRKLRAYKPRELVGGKDIDDWNAGKIRVLMAHPAGAGHGLNLQKGGNIIVWYGLTWSLELYQQACARLHRQGQSRPVQIYHLLTKGTMDEDVMKAISGKADKQEALMQAVKARINKYKGGSVNG